MKDKTERHFFCINDLFFASFKKKKHVYQSITAPECAISLCILILFLHSFKIFQKGHDTFKSEIWDVITNWSFRNLYHLPFYRILKTEIDKILLKNPSQLTPRVAVCTAINLDISTRYFSPILFRGWRRYRSAIRRDGYFKIRKNVDITWKERLGGKYKGKERGSTRWRPPRRIPTPLHIDFSVVGEE